MEEKTAVEKYHFEMFDDRFLVRDFACMCFVCRYDCFILSPIAIA